MGVDGSTGIHFNEEIVVDILSRLPVRSLLRSKCVSKIWMDMFTLHLSSLTQVSLSLAQFTENVQKLDWLYGSKPGNCKMYCCYDDLVLVGC
ncbi:hypothetical protein P3S67_002296 [Capsicum chacoense]